MAKTIINNPNLSKLSLIFLTIKIIIVSGDQPYNIQELQPDLHIEYIGDVRIEQGAVRIELSYSLAEYRNKSNGLNDVVNEMNKYCQNELKPKRIECVYLIDELRKKKAEFNFFEYEFENTKNSKKLQNNFSTPILKFERNLDKSEKIISVQINSFERDIEMYTQLKIFWNKLNNLNNRLKSTNVQDLFIETYQEASTLISEANNYHKAISNFKFNPNGLYELVSREKIASLIEEERKKISGKYEILNFVSETRTELKNEVLYLHAYFPIVEKNYFNLLKVIPVPWLENGTSWIKDVPMNILAVNNDSQTFFEITEDELKKTIRLEDKDYLYNPSKIYQIINSPNCLIKEIFGDGTCPSKEFQIGAEIIWKQLSEPYTLIFTVKLPTPIKLICGEVVNEVILNSTGVLQMSRNCVINDNGTIMIPRDENFFGIGFNHNKMVDSINVTNFQNDNIFLDSKHLFNKKSDVIVSVGFMNLILTLIALCCTIINLWFFLKKPQIGFYNKIESGYDEVVGTQQIHHYTEIH